MKLDTLFEEIRYAVDNRGVYGMAGNLMDAILQATPTCECTLYSASENICDIGVKDGEYYNQILKKKMYHKSIKLRINLNNNSIEFVGLNVTFQIGPNIKNEVANTVNRLLRS